MEFVTVAFPKPTFLIPDVSDDIFVSNSLSRVLFRTKTGENVSNIANSDRLKTSKTPAALKLAFKES